MITTLIIIFSLLMLPGFLGVFLPIVPSVPYMFVIALIYGFIDRFQHLTGREITILAILAILSFLTDHLSGLVGAKYGGASKRALLIGLLGFIVGGLMLPPLGGIAGLFLGVLIGQLLENPDQQKALKAAKSSLLGTLGGMAINFILALTFFILFIIFAR